MKSRGRKPTVFETTPRRSEIFFEKQRKFRSKPYATSTAYYLPGSTHGRERDLRPYLEQAADAEWIRKNPGLIYTEMAHAHPFLEGNGRAIFFTHAKLCEDAGFWVDWSRISKHDFLQALTTDIQIRTDHLGELIKPNMRQGKQMDLSFRHVVDNCDFSR